MTLGQLSEDMKWWIINLILTYVLNSILHWKKTATKSTTKISFLPCVANYLLLSAQMLQVTITVSIQYICAHFVPAQVISNCACTHLVWLQRCQSYRNYSIDKHSVKFWNNNVNLTTVKTNSFLLIHHSHQPLRTDHPILITALTKLPQLKLACWTHPWCCCSPFWQLYLLQNGAPQQGIQTWHCREACNCVCFWKELAFSKCFVQQVEEIEVKS